MKWWKIMSKKRRKRHGAHFNLENQNHLSPIHFLLAAIACEGKPTVHLLASRSSYTSNYADLAQEEMDPLHF